MWLEAALLAVGCVLFINMGLSDAIQETLGIEDRILSCPKCLVFWLSLAHLLLRGCGVLTAVGASFLFSYLALWLDLGLSALNRKYNDYTEKISSTPAKKKGRPRVPQMREKQ